MKFQTLLYIVIAGYVLYYGWMILSDLFLKKDAVPMEKIGEEDEVDVSDLSEDFRPQEVHKQAGVAQQSSHEAASAIVRPINTGAINIQDFLATLDDFGKDGEFSDLGKMVAQDWGARFA